MREAFADPGFATGCRELHWHMRATFALAILVGCISNEDIPPPVIASLVPDRGPPGSEITIRGSFFCQQPEGEDLSCRQVGGVQFGIQPARATLYSDELITAEVPMVVPGEVRVSIAVAGRVSNTADFTVE